MCRPFPPRAPSSTRLGSSRPVTGCIDRPATLAGLALSSRSWCETIGNGRTRSSRFRPLYLCQNRTDGRTKLLQVDRFLHQIHVIAANGLAQSAGQNVTAEEQE